MVEHNQDLRLRQEDRVQSPPKLLSKFEANLGNLVGPQLKRESRLGI